MLWNTREEEKAVAEFGMTLPEVIKTARLCAERLRIGPDERIPLAELIRDIVSDGYLLAQQGEAKTKTAKRK